MANKEFSDYINERVAEINPNRLTDYLVVRKADGTVKKVTPSRLMTSTVSGDEVPTGGGPPGEIDVSGVDDGTIVHVTGTDYIDKVLVDEGDVLWLAFQDSGGSLLTSANLEVPGKEIIWSAGDMVEVVGTAGGTAMVRQVVKASAGLSRPSVFHCRTVSTANVDISNLNNGDSMNGITLATNDIVLLAHQTATEQNGIYVVGLTAGTTARHELFDTYDDMIGILFLIDTASTLSNAPSVWTSDSPAGGVIDVNGIDFEIVVTATGRMDPRLAVLQFVSGGAWMKGIASGAFTLELWVGPTVLTGYRQFYLDVVDGNRTLKLGGDVEFTGAWSDTRPVVSKPGDYAVLAADHNTIFDNVGAAGDVVFTLPATGGCVAGKTRFTFTRLDTGGTVKVQVDGSDHLIFFNPAAGSEIDITGGSQILGTKMGVRITVLYHGGTTWTAESVEGDWS